MKKRLIAHKEAIKSILLVVLVCTMLGQTAFTWVYGLDMSAAPDNSLFAAVAKLCGYDKDGARLRVSSGPAAYPVKAMVRGSQGLYGVEYNENGVGVVYEKTKDLWKAAFGDAGKITKATDESYRQALSKSFLFMEYDGCLPIGLIAGWFGSSLSDTDTVQELCAGGLLLARFGENDYYLYIRDANSGDIYQCKTSLSDKDFVTQTGGFLENDCTLAMESDGDYSKYLPETMIFDTSMAFDVLKSTKPAFVAPESSATTVSGGNDSVRRLLEAFSYNPFTRKKYEEDNGDVENFVESYRTLRVGKNGRIRFEASDISGGIQAYARGELRGTAADMQCIELGRNITENAIASMVTNGQAVSGQVALTKWYYSAKTNTNVAVFTARAGGIPIDSEENGFFARYEFRGNMMVRAVLNMRQYVKASGEKQLYILSEKQLAAAADTQETVGLSIRYADAGGDRCTADWKLYSHEEQ